LTLHCEGRGAVIQSRRFLTQKRGLKAGSDETGPDPEIA
jgi:hypothetical protein